MTDSGERVSAAISDKRHELLEILLQRKGLSVPRSEQKICRANAESYELSFAQQRLWFLQQLESSSSLYNMTGVWSLQGPLDVDLLTRSIKEIVRRHESLRTVFVVRNGYPLAVVMPEMRLSIPLIELGDTSPAEQDSRIQRAVADQAEQVLDLEKGPLTRVALLRVSQQMHVLVVVMHHIISDGWSFRVFRKELQTLYTAYTTAAPVSLVELPVQYADFARWQRKWLDGERMRIQLAYWKKQLADLSQLELPLDRPRPPVQTYRGAKVRSTLPGPVTESLRKISQESKCTLFMTLFAGFNALLHRLTDQEDICIGIPVANRNRPEVEDLIGFFVNTLVIRTDLSDDPTFSEFLHRVRHVALEAYAHQDLPFEKLVQEIAPDRDASRNPLFQVFFNMNSPDDEQLELRDLVVGRIRRDDVKSKFDLTLYATAQKGQIRFDLVYNRDLFDHARMVEMLAQLELLLTQIVERPHERIARFSLVTAHAEQLLPNPRHPLRSRWEGAVHARLAENAKAYPERNAAVDAAQTWTYAQLDAESSRLAAYLRAEGIRQRDVVAVYGDRCVLLVLGMLGVLKAGGAFVILDPRHPSRRLHDYLRAAKPRGWLELGTAVEVPDGLRDAVPTIRCRARLSDDPRECEQFAEYSDSGVDLTTDPDGPAYIAFTSGSTGGKSKGVLGTHRPISHFLKWHCGIFDLRKSDRFAVLSGLSHDPLLRDIFTPLWLGATLCIPGPEDMEAPGHLANWMREEKVSIAHVTPPLAEVLIAETTGDGAQPITSLRYVFFGGDLLTTRHVTQMRKLAPNAICVNFYGTTETPQAMSYHIVPAHEDGSGPSGPGRQTCNITIGRGIEGAQLLIVNSAAQLAGVGERAEICIRSPYLAQGYIDDDSPTAEKFIPNPFTGAPSDRVYRTGDLGRYQPDGSVEFCGRIDRQVKIRGFRVEPAEIESALCSHPAIRQTTVAVDDNDQVGKRLIAYIAYDGSVSTLSLRRYLRSLLPEHMIPAQFVTLETLPLTSNGKVDFARLPPPPDLPCATEHHVPPRTAMEQQVAKIWRDVIGLDGIGRHDNFFDLGGHSLLVVKAVSLLESSLSIRVPFREFFNQTLAQFAAHCEKRVSVKQNYG